MNRKLAVRNVMGLAKDYLVYFLTMTFVTALMFAFNSILFSKDVQNMFEVAGAMAAMVGLATFFVVLIVAWLIHYMVRFIMEKRSREFGIYLLIGMKKKEIAGLYMRENLLLGIGAFLPGMGLGILIQQILMSVLYGMIQVNYHLHLEMNRYCILMTVACYGGCYLLALFRCRRKFRKMNIHDLMEAQRKNEEIVEKHEGAKRWLLPLSLLFLVVFGVLLLQGWLLNVGSILVFLVGLVLVIYLFYTGLSAWLICYVRKKGKAIYRGQNLFLMRQFSSKLKSMRFTMGTLTSLFTIAFLGCSAAMMFSDYQDQILQDKFPFDVHAYSSDAADDFAEELEVIENHTTVKESYVYSIYTDKTTQVNHWLYTHLQYFGDKYLKADGTVDKEKLKEEQDQSYCSFDTFMGLSDYNYLRKMLGYDPVHLEDDAYLVHVKERIYQEAGEFTKGMKIAENANDGTPLRLAGYQTEPFSQDGHNGGDYVIVVPDRVIQKMTPFYAVLAVDIKGKAPADLQRRLENIEDGAESVDYKGEASGESEWRNWCFGSDTVVTYAAYYVVRDNAIPEIRYILSTVIFPAFYIGLVFVCVALTVLTVQQLSDASKYRFRYEVLGKLGLGKKEISRLIFKQLGVYYLCPALFAAGISGVITVYISRKFIFYTGVKTSVLQYFGIAFLLFFGVYAIYFAVTYIGFKRSVEERR